MDIAETVTFGGGGLDRTAALRTAADAGRLLVRPGARVLPLWRGRPMLSDEGLGLVPPGHPGLSGRSQDFLLIGIDNHGPCFAADLSDWVPDPGQDPPGGGFHDTAEQRHPKFGEPFHFAELRMVMTRLDPVSAEIAVIAKALAGWHDTHGFCAACGAATDMAAAGWQRLCPSCGRTHFPRTDPVVIMLVTHGNRVLLGRSPGWPGGMYSLLAGFMEPGETIEAAVRREVLEEAGIRVGAVSYLASQPWPYPSSLMIGCRGMALSDRITPDPTEIEDARWVTREEMSAIMAGAHPGIRAPRKGAIAAFLLANWVANRIE
ncbi:MAG: NAD(+) diphosphatase [Pseudomonadota bacterium]